MRRSIRDTRRGRARAPDIAAAWLFGSVARGDARSDSDLDLAILFRRRGETSLDHWRELGDLASKLEGLAPGRAIDIVAIESQGPIFQHRVLVEGRLVYEADRDRRVDFESNAYVRYLDFKPTWDIAAKHAVAGVRKWLEARRG